MKKSISLIVVLAFCFGAFAFAEDGDVDLRYADDIVVGSRDARQFRVEGLNWKLRYLRCLETNLELAKCCQEKRRMDIEKQIDEVTREIRALILGAPYMKKKGQKGETK